jgi:hypothetical protein
MASLLHYGAVGGHTTLAGELDIEQLDEARRKGYLGAEALP